MDVSQSRASSRGPLIAVIKIEIDVNQVDRIFLHANDDDYHLAQEFQHKHNLSHNLVEHIYQRIKMSRQSLQKQSNPKPAVTQRSQKSGNQKSDIFTPAPKEKPTQSYGRINNDAGTPFDQIAKFTPAKEQIFKEAFIPPNMHTFQQSPSQFADSYRKQLERIQDYEALDQNELQNQIIVQKNSIAGIDSIGRPVYSSTYGNDTHQDLFSKFMAQKKRYENKNGISVASKQVHQSFERSFPFSNNDRKNMPNKISFSCNEMFEQPQQQNDSLYAPRTMQRYPEDSPQRHIETQEEKLQKQIEQLQRKLNAAYARDQSKNKNSSQQLGNFLIRDDMGKSSAKKSISENTQLFRHNGTFTSSKPKLYKVNEMKKQSNGVGQHKGKKTEKANKTNQNMFVYPGVSSLESQYQISAQNRHFHEKQRVDKPSRVKIIKKQEMESMRSSSMKKSLSKSDISKIQKQVTSRLYNEGEIKKNYLKKIKERAKIQKQEKDDPQLTYRPVINKISKVLAEDRYDGKEIQDYLIEHGKKTRDKIQAQRVLKQSKQIQGCSFMPQVSQVSKKLAEQSYRGSMLAENVGYINKALRSCSKKHHHSQTTFRPSLNKMSEAIVKNKGKGNFNERMKNFVQEKNNKLNQMMKQKLIKQKKDECGQQLFRPRITSKNPKNRSPKGSNIYEYLYEKSIGQKNEVKQDRQPKINLNSELIVQQMQLKRITWLFTQLDSDQDGFISSKRICIDTIGQDLLEVIMPVLFEMQQMDIQLNLSDFRKALANLHASLNAHEKSVLYNYSHKNSHNHLSTLCT